ncbi:MAG: hypothetical protein AAF333_13015 [Planctomycetota bacterium]
MIDPAKPFSSRPAASAGGAVTRSQVSAAKADLSGLLDRARDERFRLLKMLQDARAQVANTAEKTKPAAVKVPSVPSTEAAIEQAVSAEAPSPSQEPAPQVPQLQRLVDKLTALDTQLDAKLARLNRVTDEKLGRLEQIDGRVTPMVRQLGHALADGRMIQRDLEAAAEKSRAMPTQITGQLERFDDHLAAYQHAGADAFSEELDRMKHAALEEMRAEIGQRRLAFDAELADAQAILERELTQKFDTLADQLHDRAEGLVARTEGTANTALKRIRGEVVQAMARTHDTQEAFKQKLEEHRQHHRDYLASLADSADGEFQVHAQRLDETMAGLTELFDHQADEILNQLRDRATTLLDQMAATVLNLQDADEGEADSAEPDAERRAA